MKLRLILFLLLSSFLYMQGAFAQEVTINEDSELTRMIARYTELNRSSTQLSGWRVQLLSTTDRRQIDAMRKDLSTRYPNLYVKWEHVEPYYKLSAGAFSNRFEAYALKEKLKNEYPGAYPTKDKNIKPRELMGLSK